MIKSKHMKTTKLLLITALVLARSTLHAQERRVDDYKVKQIELRQAQIEHMEWHNATIPAMYFEMRAIQQQIDSLTAVKDSINTVRDSLIAFSNKRNEELNAQWIENLITYSTFSVDAMKDIFSSRHGHSRETLESIYRNATTKVRNSKAGKRLKQFLYAEFPSLVGTEFKPFACWNVDGKKYDWKQTEGKKIIIVLDGYGCMNHFDQTAAGRYLQSLLDAAGPDKLAIVAFVYAESKQEIQVTTDAYQIAHLNPASDMEGNISELKLKYHATGTPTIILVDENGIIKYCERGVDIDALESFAGVTPAVSLW